jgi:hypothetical protein
MSDVRTGERQVLKSTGEAAVLSGVGDERTIVGRQFATSVNRSGTRVAFRHAGTLKKVDGVLALRQEHPRSRARDRDPEEIGQVPEIGHGELTVELVGDVLKKTGAGGGEDDVVDVEQQISQVVAATKHEEGHVALRGNEAKPVSVVGEALVPRPGRLLQAIKRLVEQADVLGPSGVDEARWLLAVDHLVKIAMQEGVLNVKLMNRPSARDGDAEDDTDRGRFNNQTESLVVVDPGLLREPANHPPSLVPSQITIGAEFMLEDPLA